MTPSVSAIITTFNRASLCRRAIESALEQTHRPIEVLVWDDGSDSTEFDLLSAVADAEESVRLFRGAHSGTPAVGRNRLAATARGDWVAFLDDDDRWLPGKLEAQLRHRESADVISSAMRREDGSLYSPYVGRVSRRRLYRGNVLLLSTVALRRSVFLPFDERPDRAGVEDYLAWLKLSDAGVRILCTPDIVATYDDSHDGRLSDRVIRGQARVAQAIAGQALRRPQDVALGVGTMYHATRTAKLAARRALEQRKVRE